MSEQVSGVARIELVHAEEWYNDNRKGRGEDKKHLVLLADQPGTIPPPTYQKEKKMLSPFEYVTLMYTS